MQLNADILLEKPLEQASGKGYTLLFWPGNIVEYKFASNSHINEVEAREMLAHQLAFKREGKGLRLLIDIRANTSSSREAKEISKDPRAMKTNLGLAVIVENQFTRIVGNAFLTFNVGDIPKKLFTSRDEAIAWLRQLKEK